MRVDLEPNRLEEMRTVSVGRTFPQIIINGKGIGGFDDLYKLHKSDQLKELL